MRAVARRVLALRVREQNTPVHMWPFFQLNVKSPPVGGLLIRIRAPSPAEGCARKSRPAFVSRSLFLSLSFDTHSLLLLPFPWLLFSRTLLTRQADPPYPAGGPSLPGRRILLPPYSEGGYPLLGRRILPGGPPSLGADITCSAQRILPARLSGYYLLLGPRRGLLVRGA